MWHCVQSPEASHIAALAKLHPEVQAKSSIPFVIRITKWNIPLVIWITKCLGICYEKTKTQLTLLPAITKLISHRFWGLPCRKSWLGADSQHWNNHLLNSLWILCNNLQNGSDAIISKPAATLHFSVVANQMKWNLTSIFPSKSWGMVPSTHVPFILFSMLSNNWNKITTSINYIWKAGW